MKLHDLRPAAGAHTRRTRVGRGIAAGGGKTAGRGTKGQKARAGGSIPAWFEGGQTPLHQRIPKLRGFKNPFKTQFEIVNLGRIAELVELGALEPGEMPGAKAAAKDKDAAKPAKAAPITINQELLRAVGAVRTLDKPLKVLGHGEIARALFVVADAFSRTAVAKIEAAGGSVQVIELPTTALKALGVEGRDGADGDAPARETAAARRAAKRDAEEAADEAPPAKPAKASVAPAAAKAESSAKPAAEVTSDQDDESTDERATQPARTAKTADPVRRATAAPSPEGLAPEAESSDAEVITDLDNDSDAEPATKPTRSTKTADPVRRATAAPSPADPAPDTEPASEPSADIPAGEDA
jgi:large subunit ribosomal protein L15